jgi:DMSO/TMAO reductase YedYZ molybdopterin-dependent catalytic subunit
MFFDGQPLHNKQGFPLRKWFQEWLIGYKSIKWVNRVEFASSHIEGY